MDFVTSTGKLDDEGYCNTFSDGQWKLTKGAMVVAHGMKHSALYILQEKISNDIVNAMEDNGREHWNPVKWIMSLAIETSEVHYFSTTEAEFIAATKATKELLWANKFLRELGFEQHKYVLLFDSQSAIHLA
ncbi:uncharacterized protein LOC131153823 [Malania oleifera]|uniref:uncharacterized protein LOC131153823 n=1 Tax=Malania oleifera TaxID=397392 RepID=UPI0025AE89FE|nr:uncharacterized protein LOC131153823 [Malania oleifera]